MHMGEWFGPAEVSGTVLPATGTLSTLAAPNENRRAVAFFNHSSNALFIKLGNGATTADFSRKIESGSYWYVENSPLYTGSITGIWAADGGNLMVTEWSAPEPKY